MISRTLALGAAITVIVLLITTGMILGIPMAARLGGLGHGGGGVVTFLIAILLIITVGWVGGWVAVRLRQPQVVGEMVAGILLGPSLLGQVSPAAGSWLFPVEILPHLGFAAEMAIVTFMFMFGTSLPLQHLRGSGLRVSVLGIGMVAVPVLLGMLLAGFLSGEYRPTGVSSVSFLLFVGVSMGVTAFPVLVRILAERGLTKTRVGTLGLTAAGIDDAIAWCLLALAVATARDGSPVSAAWTVALLVVFAAVVWAVIRPALRCFLAFAGKHAAARASAGTVLLLSAWSGAFITDWIGVHAIFGAFLIGLAMPRENLQVKNLTRATERGVAVVLPLFFAVVGLSVQLGLLSHVRDLMVCGLVILVAVTGKIGATTVIARLTRLRWRESVALGVMVNCRGLTGLVVLTTGLSFGIIGPDLFVMFVIMALVTTLMTGPLLGRLRLVAADEHAEPAEQRRPAMTASVPG
jgi:K+:H+ antiporter